MLEPNDLPALSRQELLALVADRIPVPRLDQVALDLPIVAFTAATAGGLPPGPAGTAVTLRYARQVRWPAVGFAAAAKLWQC